MRFSLAKMLTVIVLVNILVCLSFAVPVWIGFPLLTLISVLVLPPAILVGVFNTRGIRQAFFVGCMSAGVPHFILSVYLLITGGFSIIGGDWAFSGTDADETAYLRLIHIVGYVFGLIGGCSGMLMFWFLKIDSKTLEKTPPQVSRNQTFESSVPMETVSENFETSIPR